MRRAGLGLAGPIAIAIAIAFGGAASAEPTVTVLPLPFAATEFRGPGSRVAAVVASTDGLRAERALADRPLVAVWGRSGGAALTLDGGAIRVVRLRGGPGDLSTAERGRDAIPGSRIESAGPLTVELTEPTGEYPHEALGSAVHAASLSVRERRPVSPGGDPKLVPVELTRIPAGPGAVFEDREPRLVSFPGGTAIVTVRSDRARGSSLLVLSKRDGRWATLAETPPTGEPARWLNPAAVADFLGTGRPQVALVQTPHGEGIVEIWDVADGTPALKAAKAGYSNHAFGAAAQDLAAAFDLDGDGRAELVLPTGDRHGVAILSFRAGGAAEIRRIPLPARVATGLAVLGTGAEAHILAGLEDGRVADIRP